MGSKWGGLTVNPNPLLSAELFQWGSKMVLPVYGIFEGGGAKGIGHIAALKAAERADLDFIGVAGASAGALIAALVAVGYKADELFNPDAPSDNILKRNGISPLSLLGEREWTTFETAKRKKAKATQWAVFGGALAACLISRSAVRVAWKVRSTGGYFSTEHVRESLNRLLRDKLRKHYADAGNRKDTPERVRFRDIDPTITSQCCSLKVIVTDVTNRRMVVFGTPGSEDVEVAEAVAASIAIPALFEPAHIPSFKKGGDALYADGGLVSNLPIWAFGEEKLNYERIELPFGKVPIVAFSLTDPKATPQSSLTPGSFDYWVAAGHAAISGGQTVAQLFAADLRQFQIPIGLDVTEFRLDVPRVCECYKNAYPAVTRNLIREMNLLPRRRVELLESFHAEAITLINKLLAKAGGEVRVSLLRPVAGTRSFCVENSYNMDNDADDRLVFNRLALGAPRAFDKRGPDYIDFAALWAAGKPQYMTKYEFALLRRSLKSAICLPIFADGKVAWQQQPSQRPEPLGVVSVDSDEDLTAVYKNRAVIEALVKGSLPLAEVLGNEAQ